VSFAGGLGDEEEAEASASVFQRLLLSNGRS
jgi:hypothetical protein